MDAPHFFCPYLSPGLLELDEHESHHAQRSLRLQAGDAVILFDGRGHFARAAISAGHAPRTRKRAAATVVEAQELVSVPWPQRRLTLIVPGCKGDALAWMVEKCTELGVTRLVFAELERSVVHVSPAHAKKLERTAIEACKQCGRFWLPRIDASSSVWEAIAGEGSGRVLAAHLDPDVASLAEVLEKCGSVEHIIGVVGPEGGLSSAEIKRLRALRSTFARLGEHVLRVETATIAFAANWAAHAWQAVAM